LLLERRARHRAENESRRNLALAADVSRRETMSTLNNSISHELGQPISAMIFNTEALQTMLASRGATPESINEILADIHADGIRAAKIMDRNRSMLRSRQLQKKPIDLQVFIKDALALVSHDIRARQVAVSFDLPPTPCIISGDPVLLQQVFVNLILNAMDAMMETPPDRRHLTIGIEVRRAVVEISVRDTGPGLPQEIGDKLFTPFVTTKPHGLGIGLAIARTIVDAHVGRISACNHPQGGAVFTVALKVSHAHESGEPTVIEAVGESPEN
jgi:C4-dicarboxylate-specific signal transduction histidine kinase